MEKSLSELMNEAFDLALDLVYETIAPNGSYFDTREIPGDNGDRIYSWADGLMHKYYDKHASGRCSIQAMIDFDVAEFEEAVKKDIAMMKDKAKIYGPPKKLSYATMRERGYTGSWAGMDDAGNIVNP